MTRETVEEMIAAALNRVSLNPRTAVDSEAEQALLDQYQKKIAVLEKERDETFKEIANLECQRDGAFAATKILSREKDEALEKIAALEKKGDEDRVKIQYLKDDLKKTLHEVTWAKSKAVAAWESDATVEIARKQDELDVVLAAMKAVEAKVAHLESQLAKIHSLSESDAIIASTSTRPDDDQAELASQKSLPQTEGHWTIDSEFFSQTQGTWTDLPQTEGDRNVAYDDW